MMRLGGSHDPGAPVARSADQNILEKIAVHVRSPPPCQNMNTPALEGAGLAQDALR